MRRPLLPILPLAALLLSASPLWAPAALGAEAREECALTLKRIEARAQPMPEGRRKQSIQRLVRQGRQQLVEDHDEFDCRLTAARAQRLLK